MVRILLIWQLQFCEIPAMRVVTPRGDAILPKRKSAVGGEGGVLLFSSPLPQSPSVKADLRPALR
ncbi:hypothetical protein Pla52o_15710 [Novipirellula galeiformis]|uniref:Uncharacterized protein n=1 Tax=Novipirellula galeiformis TaxID=2528004 RepID=A0A5C6CK77_9BACT|nr:hypothetical protein Pla52o_15710 [Novipirellula galeiformis]